MSSTYSLKGFVTIQTLIDNNPNIVSNIGEMSLWSMTYTKDRGEYKNVAYPGYKLTGLSSVDSVAGKIPVNATTADATIDMAQWSYNWLYGKTLPISKSAFLTAVNNQFFGQIADLNCGEFMQQGAAILPEWMSWSMDDGTTVSQIRIWFADIAFRQQFDEYEIVVIPPVDDIDDLFTAYSSAVTLIQSRTAKDTTDLVQDAKAGSPETYIRTLTFDFINTANTTQSTNTNWNVLIYGIQGDSYDIIREAIIAYIAANSTHTVAQWTAIMPDLFKATEFMMIPRWDLMAIPDLTLIPGIFSPNINPTECLSFALANIPDYLPAHVTANTEVIGHPYRSLSVLCCGNPDNAINKLTLKMMYPDYINVGTLSTDFNRMTVETKNFSNMLQEMLMIANSMTAFTVVPSKYRIVTRNSKLFLSSNVDNVSYLVSARANF